MELLVVGLSHKNTPVEIRERVAFPPTALERALRALHKLPSVAECLILSTCNRVELVAASRQPEKAEAEIAHFMANYHDMEAERLEPHLYVHHGREALRHLFRVASSLDSMVLGEPQILGQLKTAYNAAVEYGTVSLILNRGLHKAFSVAKRVRTETAIASSAVSVSYAAVELARKIFDNLEDKTVLLIGAGEMCELAARHFVTQGVARVLVTNRTLARAESLARDFDGAPIPFDCFHDELHRADIVLSSTGAPGFVLQHDQVHHAIKQRRFRPMLLIDIAVPRDIDPACNGTDGVYLYDVDDLQGVVAANLKERQKEVTKAEAIIEEEIGSFLSWLETLEVVPTLRALRARFDDVRQAELEKTLVGLRHLGEKEQQAVAALSQAIVNKLLHQPMVVLKASQNDSDGSDVIDVVRRLFDLPQPDTEQTPEGGEEDL